MKTLVLAAMLFMQGVPQQRLQPGVITGQVRMADGSPAARIRVAALAEGAGQSRGSTLSAFVQTDDEGRYRLESVLPGRYYIIAGLIEYPTYYPGVKALADSRIVTVEPGSSVGSIDFALARPAGGIRVSGRVTGLPSGLPSGLFKAMLVSSGPPMTRLDGPVQVQSDGSFEFPKVMPGRYNVRLSLDGPSLGLPIIVDDMDISGLKLTAPPILVGRVIVEGGGSVPIQAAAIAASLPDPPSLLLLYARGPGASGSFTTARVRSDGLFVWSLPAGEYQVGPTLIPIGYDVKAMSYGSDDLLKTALKVADLSAAEMQVILTPPGSTQRGVTVSGRLAGLDGASGPIWISMQSNPQTRVSAPGMIGFRIGETLLRADGTFQFPNVPPGTYTLQPNFAGSDSIPLFQSIPPQNIVVADLDVSGIELTLPPSPR